MKNKFLSRIGQWHTPPYLRKCLTSLKSLTLLLVMLMSVNVWGEDETVPFTFTNKDQLQGWTSNPAPGSCETADAARGLAWSKAAITSFSYTLSDYGVSKVSIVASANATGYTLFVNGGTGQSVTKSNNTTYNFDVDVAKGSTITISTTKGDNVKSFWIKTITLTKAGTTPPSGKDVTITAESELNLTFEESDGTINVTYGEDVADKDINLYDDAECTTPFTGDWFDAELNSITGNIDYIAEANTGAAREAYIQIYVMADDAETENTKVIKVTQEGYKEPTGTFAKVTELEEGDYVIYSGGTALLSEVASSRFKNFDISLTGDKIVNPDEAVIWTVAKEGDYWTFYNAAVEKYMGAGTAKNTGALISPITDFAKWTYDEGALINLGRSTATSDQNNKYLRKNGTNGWASYSSTQGTGPEFYKKEVPAVYSAITLATCENGSVSVTGAADLTSVASGTTITLGNTPADGYKLDAYDVYKTDDATTKVTVKDGKFKMPAYAVTVSATFSLSIETPTLSEAAGDKDDAFSVKVTNYNGDYSYYYTLDGTEPSNASTLYVDADGIAINASCTLKVIAYKGDVTSPVASATYNLPLMTMDAIFAKATAVGSTATAVRVKFTNCVITGVKNNNAYLTDNAGKGLIIYASSHGFEVNDKLNGAVNVKVQLYNGSAEITTLTSSTSGLTVTKDGSVSPITTIGIADLTGVNTGAVLSYTNLTSNGTDFSDGTNTLTPYNTFITLPSFENGDKYNVTGVYIQYNAKKEIAPRTLADLQKIEATKYAINLSSVEHGSISTTPETEAADGVKVTLSATPDAGYMLGEWSVTDADGAAVTVTNNQFTMPAKEVTVSATFVELPIWATTYTSNVTLSGNKVKLAEAYQPADYPEDGYDAKKDGSSSAKASISVKVPANTTGLHYHLFAWKGEGGKTVSIKKGETVLATFTNIADDGVSGGSTTYELINNPVDAYGYVALEGITEETTITFSTPANSNRICLFGVNAIQPAAITIDPASKDFGEVKQGFDAEQVFTLTPNAFATGTITAEIEGEGFSASAVADNKVTVTFAPTEIKDDYSATLVIKHDGTQMCSATLTGKGIAATTPTIDVDKDNIDFDTKKQGESFESQTVAVTLNYLSAATVAVTGNFEVTPTSLTGSGNVTVSVKSTADAGTFDGTLTISGEGASDKVVSLHAVVADKWATTYSSNINDINDFNIEVVVEEVSYEDSGIKIGSSGKGGSATLKIPEGTEKLHFHVAAWKDKSTGLTVKMGETTLREIASTDIPSEAGVSGSGSTYTLVGNTSTDQYFNIDLSGYTIEDNTEITFTTSSERVALYGVNQEGGVTTVLQSIEIQGTATALNYEIGQSFDPKGLKVVGTFQKGEEEPTTRDLSSSEFDWSFDPATFTSTEQTSVVVTATAKENTEVTANKTIENIVVIAPVVEITTTTTKVDFGTVAQNATVDNELVYVTFKNCTEASVALSGDDAEMFTIDANKVEAGDFNWVTVGVAEGVTATAGEYAAILTIHAEGAIADIVLPVTLFVEAPDVCDGTDDFETVDAVTSYGTRTTTAGWTATNSRVDVVDDYTYFTINGKTSASGVITSPVLEGGIASLKLRYGHLVANETNGVSFRVDIKQDEEVVKTYTITKPNDQVVRDEVYTEMISDVNVAGTFQIVITNLCPSQSSSNKDRVAIGRLCWTHYAGAPEYDETVRENVTAGTIGTMVYEHNITAIAGAVIYEPNYVDVDGNVLEFIEVLPENTVAGLPYIFVANGENDGKVQINFGTDEPADGCEYKHRGLVGNIDNPNLYVSAPSYAIYQNQIRPANYTKVAVGRAYIENITVLYELEPIVTAAPRRRFSLGIERSMPTGFETIMMQKGMNKVIMNNQLYLIRDGKLFNAQGALVK